MVEILVIITSICCAVSLGFCSWRFYLRVVVPRRLPLIELPILGALFMQLVHAALQFKKLELLAKPKSPEIDVQLGKLNIAGAAIYLTCLWSVKLSVNLLHIRLTKKIPEVCLWAVRTLYVVVISWIAMYIILFVSCLPFSRRWNGKCQPVSEAWDMWTHIAFNIALDIWLCVLPYPALMKIRERRLRVAVYIVYGLALIVIIVSTMRAIIIGKNWKRGFKYIFGCSVVELATCVVIGAIPGVSSIFTRKYVNGSAKGSSASNFGRSNTYRTYEASQLASQKRIEIYKSTHTSIQTTHVDENSGDGDLKEKVVATAA